MKAKLLVFLPVMLVFTLAGAVTSLFPFGEQTDLEASIAETQAELEAVRMDNASLEAEARALEGPAEIEKVAREELGYVFPGETPYVVVEAQDPPDQVETPEPLPPAEPWYSRIIDYLTGRDVGTSA